MTNQPTEIAIVGGGMVGGALALGLAQHGFSVTVIEHAQSATFVVDSQPDVRISAISALGLMKCWFLTSILSFRQTVTNYAMDSLELGTEFTKLTHMSWDQRLLYQWSPIANGSASVLRSWVCPTKLLDLSFWNLLMKMGFLQLSSLLRYLLILTP